MPLKSSRRTFLTGVAAAGLAAALPAPGARAARLDLPDRDAARLEARRSLDSAPDYDLPMDLWVPRGWRAGFGRSPSVLGGGRRYHAGPRNEADAAWIEVGSAPTGPVHPWAYGCLHVEALSGWTVHDVDIEHRGLGLVTPDVAVHFLVERSGVLAMMTYLWDNGTMHMAAYAARRDLWPRYAAPFRQSGLLFGLDSVTRMLSESGQMLYDQRLGFEMFNLAPGWRLSEVATARSHLSPSSISRQYALTRTGDPGEGPGEVTFGMPHGGELDILYRVAMREGIPVTRTEHLLDEQGRRLKDENGNDRLTVRMKTLSEMRRDVRVVQRISYPTTALSVDSVTTMETMKVVARGRTYCARMTRVGGLPMVGIAQANNVAWANLDLAMAFALDFSRA